LVFGELLFYFLIGGLFLAFIIILIKIKVWRVFGLRFPSYYMIEIIILTPGCNIHKMIKPEKLPHKETIFVGEGEGKDYNVTIEDLWKVKYIFLKRPYYWLRRIRGRYLCLFRASESGEPIKHVESKATPVLIRNVKKSKILGKALSEIFKGGIGGFSKFILIILAVGITLYIAYSQGMIG